MSAPSPPLPPAPPAAVPPPAAVVRKQRGPLSRLMARGFLLVVLAVGAVAFAPTLIGRTGLRHQLFAFARPGLPEGITIGEATLGWFSPVVFRDLRIPDLQGQTLLTCAEIRTDRPLWELASTPDDVGRIILTGLNCQVQLHASGSNLGDILARLKSTPARRTPPRVRLECHQAQVGLTDASGVPVFACAEIEAVFDDLRQGDAPATATFSTVTTYPSTQGRAELAAAWSPPMTDEQVIGPGVLDFRLVRWPLDPLQPWVHEPLGAAALAGELSLRINSRWDALAATGGAAELRLLVENLNAALQPADPVAALQTFQTQNAELTLQGIYDGTADRLTLVNSNFTSEWASGAVQGTLSDLRGQCVSDITGDVILQLANAQQWLPPGLAREVRIEGIETRRIAIRGALRPDAPPTANASFPTPLAVEAAIAWKLLEAFGLTSPDAELHIAYAADRVTPTPTRVPVSGGRIASLPAVELAETGPRLQFFGQPLLEGIAFNEAMCRSWMRYLSPLLANTTSIDGTFTLTVDAGTVPLEQWLRTALSGTLAIQSARVGPGPLTQQILGLVQQIRGLAERRGPLAGDDAGQWLTIQEQQVHFAVRDGRVEHSDLRLLVGPISIESRGSVGLDDESLDLLLVIRFPESWFENRPLLASLRGDGLKVPIRGTLTQPQVESRPLLEFGRGIGVRAADGLLRKLLEREQRQ